jgi:hypothetical protein
VNPDPGNPDPGNQDPGNPDPGNQDPGNQILEVQDLALTEPDGASSPGNSGITDQGTNHDDAAVPAADSENQAVVLLENSTLSGISIFQLDHFYFYP